ncbi:TOMM precursor leader peptide-binding protein [Schumannella soli]|uniref:TOMM leader peptide-binding protein n=1 Tax=Schumannella soli TaxID=2590779 RepID=A0A506Y047_9MICO|nr:TOMM precursor leader peptide-binding protein [Schumannella soli]
MVLRLDPDVPVLWRSPDSLQIGALRVHGVLEQVGPAEERVLQALRGGASRAALEVLAEQAGGTHLPLDAVLAMLRPALARSPRTGTRAALFGAGRIPDAVHRLLADRDLLDEAGPAPGDTARSARPSSRTRSAGRGEVIAVPISPWIIRPADSGHWLRRDALHLPVVVGDGALTIGPLIRPGSTACLHCIHRHRVDADPAWPALAAQLIDRPAPNLDALESARAAVAIAERIEEVLDDPAAALGHQIEVDLRARDVSGRRWPPHPECRCGAHPGSDWAHAAAPTAPPLLRPATPTS